MATPIVDTFEHDIANEIRHKEASIADIATAVGDIGNEEDAKPKHNIILIEAVVVLILCGIIGASYIAYTYYNGGTVPVAPKTEITADQKSVSKGSSVAAISPAIDQSIGGFLTNVQKSKAGYSMNITSYSPVFVYMLKNENVFGDEIGIAVGNSHVIKKTATATTTLNVATTTPQTTSSSTQSKATSTQASTTVQVITNELPTSYTFSDITISNQNMRIATSAYGTVVYAFIGTQRLVISSSTEGILALRNNVLQK